MFLWMNSYTTGTFVFQEKTVVSGMNLVSRLMGGGHLILEMICMQNSLQGNAFPSAIPSLNSNNP